MKFKYKKIPEEEINEVICIVAKEIILKTSYSAMYLMT